MKSKNDSGSLGKESTARSRENRKLAKNQETSADVLALLIGEQAPIDRLVARHPNADETTLRKLGSSSDKTTRKYVTANPNSPKGVLLELANQFPREFLDNPLLDLLLLENPGLLDDMPVSTLRSLLKREFCPEAFLSSVGTINDKGVRLALTQNAGTPAQVLEALKNSGDRNAREAANLHVNIAGEIGDEWQDILESSFRKTVESSKPTKSEAIKLALLVLFTDIPFGLSRDIAIIPRVARILAGQSLTPPEILVWVAKSEDRLVRVNLAGNPHTPVSVLEMLGYDKSRSVCECVGSSELLTVEALSRLAKHEVNAVRRKIASNTSTPDSVLKQLAKDNDDEVRGCVACNISTPISVLNHLAEDEDYFNVSRVARNEKAPPELLIKLSQNKESYVREQVAENRCTSLDVLKKLACDSDDYVRNRVAENPNCPASVLEKLAVDKDEYVRTLVARNPMTPITSLERIAHNEEDLDQLVRREKSYGYVLDGLVDNPKTPENVLIYLASKIPIMNGDDIYHLFKLSKHPNSSTRVKKLCAEKIGPELPDRINKATRKWITQNPYLPENVFLALLINASTNSKYSGNQYLVAELIKNNSLNKDVIERLIKDENKILRYLIASYSGTPQSLLEEAALDPEFLVRRGVAENPNAPVVVLEKLANESSLKTYVASNPGASAETIKLLAKDNDGWIRRKVAARKDSGADILLDLSQDDDKYVRRSVASNPAANHEIVDLLATDRENFVRQGAAANKNASLSVLERLAVDKNHDVRWALICRDELPRSIIEELARDKERHIRTRAEEKIEDMGFLYSFDRLGKILEFAVTDLEYIEFVYNSPDIKQRAREKLIEKIPAYLVAICCKPASPSLSRFLGFYNSVAPPKTLAKYFRSLDWRERCAISRNPNTPTNIVEKLKSDGNRVVRAAARGRGAIDAAQ